MHRVVIWTGREKEIQGLREAGFEPKKLPFRAYPRLTTPAYVYMVAVDELTPDRWDWCNIWINLGRDMYIHRYVPHWDIIRKETTSVKGGGRPTKIILWTGNDNHLQLLRDAGYEPKQLPLRAYMPPSPVAHLYEVNVDYIYVLDFKDWGVRHTDIGRGLLWVSYQPWWDHVRKWERTTT